MIDKFKLSKITNNIFLITEPWNKEGCNIFLFKEKNNALIFDTGLGLFSLKEFVKKININNFIVYLTHVHFDHFGGISNFSEKECFGTSQMKINISDIKTWGLEYLKPEYFKKSILYKVTNKDPLDICREFANKNYSLGTTASNKIKWFDFNFEIIPLGGHTSDSCIYYDKINKILVSGDLLYDGEVYADCYSSNKNEFLYTLDLISRLDFDLVLPGHNKIMNHEEAMQIIKKWKISLQKK